MHQIMHPVLISFICILACVTISVGAMQNSSISRTARDVSGGWGWSTQNHSNSSHGLQSFFDIALTALAFLSFGIFLINLLINALAFSANSQGINPTAPIITNTGDTGRGRERRSVPMNLDVDPMTSMDSLAASILRSIDAFTTQHEGQCIHRSLCDGNKQATFIGRGFEYLMPISSMGASWLGHKWGLHEKHIIPQHIDAILLGNDEGNCHAQFPQCYI